MNTIDRIIDFFERHLYAVTGTIVFHFLLAVAFSFWGLSIDPEQRTTVIKMDFSEPRVEKTKKQIEQQAQQHVQQDLEQASNKAKNLANTTRLPANYNKIDESKVNANDRETAEQEIRERLKALEQEVIQEQRDKGYGYTKEEAEQLINSKKQLQLEQVEVQDARSEGAVTGPTNITFKLDNRYDTYMYVPVYLCKNSGQVTVNIAVDRSGTVANAVIDQETTRTADQCLLDAALKAARSSQFNSSTNAPALQAGSITFRFVAQQ